MLNQKQWPNKLLKEIELISSSEINRLRDWTTKDSKKQKDWRKSTREDIQANKLTSKWTCSEG
jgi:hypothetical protein